MIQGRWNRKNCCPHDLDDERWEVLFLFFWIWKEDPNCAAAVMMIIETETDEPAICADSLSQKFLSQKFFMLSTLSNFSHLFLSIQKVLLLFQFCHSFLLFS